MGGVAIFTVVVCTAYAVFMRYVFNMPPAFVDEVAGYLLIVTVFLGLSYTLKSGVHIKISLLTNRLSPRVQNLLDAITLTIGLAYIALFTKWAFALWLFNWEGNFRNITQLHTPLWIPQTAFIVGFPLFSLQLMVVIIRRIKAFRSANGKPPLGGK